MQASTTDELPPLSNDDIELLYEIVTEAQDLPGPPFHALYAAYETVLARHGLATDHDRILIRFIFHMQDGPREGGDLFAHFQAKLARMGIEIEVDREGEGVEDITRNLDHQGLNGYASASQQARRAPSRRASFNSMYDATHYSEDNNAAARRRLSTYGNGVERPSSRATDQGVAGRARSHSRSRALPPLPIRGRVSQRAVSDTLAYRPKRSGSVSSQGSLRIRRNPENPLSQLHDSYSADESEGSIAPVRNHSQYPHQNQGRQFVPPEIVYRPTEAEMLDWANTFLYDRTKINARRCFQQWRDATSQAREDEENLELKAISYHRTWIVRRAFEEWHSGLKAKQQKKETERFWNRQESRAGRTYNLFLLSKAFSHWAQCASDEVKRTSEARRHILRTKYFKAWREITAVNEFKVRRVGLRKFFGIWRKRTAAIKEQNVQALAVYQENVVYRHYQRWSWQFFERRAPWWYAGRLKKSFFLRWASITRLLQEREVFVEQIRVHDVQRKTLREWSEKTAAVRGLEPLQRNFRAKALLSTAFRSLRKQAQLKPLFAQVSQQKDNRLARSALQTWHLQTKLSRQATAINQQRIIRNALTAWNDHLRCQILTSRINDRLVVQVLYKWLLESRASLFIRVRNTRLKRSTFTQWIAKAQDQRRRLDTAEQNFTVDRTISLMRGCLTKLRDTARLRQNQSALALSLYDPKIVQRAFNTLLDHHDHIVQLNQDAERANYYVTTKHAIRHWRNATQHSRIQREEEEAIARRIQRREAYVQVRRDTKMGLTRRMLGKWRDRTAQLAVQERQAAEMRENWLWRDATALFGSWHGRSNEILSLEHQAERFRVQKLLTHAFATWTERYRHVQELETQAVALKAESQAVGAATCLKKLRWRIFQLQRQEDSAIALQRRNWEKHVKAMVRFWSEQAREREAQRAVSPSPRPGRRPAPTTGEGEGVEEQEIGEETIARGENWTAFDEGAFLSGADLNLSLSFSPDQVGGGLTAASTGLRPSIRNLDVEQRELETEIADQEPEVESERPFLTSTPGYLRTPSKRNTARALARGRLLGFGGGSAAFNPAFGAASAPPASRGGLGDEERGPIGGITSFERRLRAQGIGGRRGSAVRPRGRGRVGFEDIVEEGR
ncbi:Sfi1-domain-containing protein [Mytilinidion resinicola]|uniref:Sfi1-domain-containing protein n=1 Tax=Mytilinidion resinicola TaxID=574789 RepID=A0A6A6YWL4_9PEZI|nr:Sfi1-domain-containing protein [Mytilinidion resinicola]KAF2812384.1 Sfi1-domain-containing protein [Mytilinidion resinicola]